MPASVETIAPTGIDCVCYLAKDYARAKDFYQGVMGLRPTAMEGPSWTEFELPDGGSFALAKLPDDQWYPTGGVMFAVPDVAAAVARLREAGIQIHGDVTETEVCTMSWCNDTEGNNFAVHKRKRKTRRKRRLLGSTRSSSLSKTCRARSPSTRNYWTFARPRSRAITAPNGSLATAPRSGLASTRAASGRRRVAFSSRYPTLKLPPRAFPNSAASSSKACAPSPLAARNGARIPTETRSSCTSERAESEASRLTARRETLV